jgi:histidinol-phosphate aminotransferase
MMHDQSDARQNLLQRGYSRRQAARIMTVLGAGVAAASAGTPLWAQRNDGPEEGHFPKVRIGSNECWTGPFPVAQAEAARIIRQSNFYHPGTEITDFKKTLGTIEGVPADHILPWPGSSDPLSRIVVAFCSPKKGLVTADVSYEQPWGTAEWAGAKVTKVPLTADHRHDVKAMLAADPYASLYYVCSPNNPTGTLTPIEDIEWLVANKPAGSVVLVDEAYLHFSHAKSAAYLAARRDDVVVLRTFSKLFGMAGMRLGATIASPALHEQLMRYDGKRMSTNLPLPSVVCGTVALTQKALIEQRKAEMIAARDYTFAHLKKRGIKFVPSDANMFMVDWGKPAKGVQDQFLAAGIGIGRSWAPWPTMSRVTVGSMADMQAFCTALDKIMV